MVAQEGDEVRGRLHLIWRPRAVTEGRARGVIVARWDASFFGVGGRSTGAGRRGGWTTVFPTNRPQEIEVRIMQASRAASLWRWSTGNSLRGCQFSFMEASR
jgi:hypothetical protein